MRVVIVVALLAFALALPLAGASGSAGRCQTTAANGNTPNAGHPSLFGNGRLATFAYRVIRVDSRTRNPDGSISEKFAWWGAADVRGNLKISGSRLDRRGGKVTGSVSPGTDTAYPELRFWAVGVRFPTVGCWKVIGTAETDRLALVVLVRR